MIGTDTGTMDYSVGKDIMGPGSIGWQKDFQNVTLFKGKVMTSEIKADADISDIKLFVTDGNKVTAEVMEDGTEIPYSGFAMPATLSVNYKSITSITTSGGQEPITWTSSDTSVATVDADGNVTAVGRSGTAVITAETADGQSAECTVKVSMTIWQWIVYILFFGWLWGF